MSIDAGSSELGTVHSELEAKRTEREQFVDKLDSRKYSPDDEQILRDGSGLVRSRLRTELANFFGKDPAVDQIASISYAAEKRITDSARWWEDRISKAFGAYSQEKSLVDSMTEYRGIKEEETHKLLWGVFSVQEAVFSWQFRKNGRANSHELPSDEVAEAESADRVRTWRDTLGNFFDMKREKIDGSLSQAQESWKGFLSYLRRDKMNYAQELSDKIDIRDPEQLANLLEATARSFLEIEEIGRKAKQPIGFMEYPTATITVPVTGNNLEIPISATRVVERQSDEPVLITLYKMDTDGSPVGKQISWEQHNTEGEMNTWKTRINTAVASAEGWQSLGTLDRTLIAVNLDPTLDKFAVKRANTGFHTGEKYFPPIVIQQCVRDNIPYVEQVVQHQPFDGILLKSMMRGLTEGESKHGTVKGIDGHMRELTGNGINPERSKVESDGVIVTVCEGAVEAQFNTEGKWPADIAKYCVEYGMYQYIGAMREIRKGRYKRLPNAIAGNVVITTDPAEPLIAGGSYYGELRDVDEQNPLYKIRHVIPLFNNLNQFKLLKEKARTMDKHREPPPTMQSMILLHESNVPDGVKIGAMRLNDDHSAEPLRSSLVFPATITVQTDNERHTTPAGRDIPNPYINPTDNGVYVNYSADEDSRFVPPDELEMYAKLVTNAAKMRGETIHRWMGSGESLEELNSQLDDLDRQVREQNRAAIIEHEQTSRDRATILQRIKELL